MVKFMIIFSLVDELFEKALQFFENCLSVSNSLWEKLVSALDSPMIFDERFELLQ